jgi:hypothetical protein
LPTTPQGQQQQQRTFDVLRKPDIFKSYRQNTIRDMHNLLFNLTRDHNRHSLSHLIIQILVLRKGAPQPRRDRLYRAPGWPLCASAGGAWWLEFVLK